MFLCFFRPYGVPRGVKSKCNELIFNSLHLLAERGDSFSASLRKRPEGRWRTQCVRICSACHVKMKKEAHKGLLLHFAEREGFEPTVRKAYNGFRDRPDRPLRHLSSLALGIFIILAAPQQIKQVCLFSVCTRFLPQKRVQN